MIALWRRRSWTIFSWPESENRMLVLFGKIVWLQLGPTHHCCTHQGSDAAAFCVCIRIGSSFEKHLTGIIMSDTRGVMQGCILVIIGSILLSFVDEGFQTNQVVVDSYTKIGINNGIYISIYKEMPKFEVSNFLFYRIAINYELGPKYDSHLPSKCHVQKPFHPMTERPHRFYICMHHLNHALNNNYNSWLDAC